MPSPLKFVFFAVSLLCAIPLAPASAIPITVSFAVAGVTHWPNDSVTGSFVYDAASTTSVIGSLISVDLTIEGHTYSLDEVGAVYNNMIGGSLRGVQTLQNFTDDFFLYWNPDTLSPIMFTFSCSPGEGRGYCAYIFDVRDDDRYTDDHFTQFSVTAATAVPEPNSVAMLLAGLLGFVSLHLIRRRMARGVSAA